MKNASELTARSQADEVIGNKSTYENIVSHIRESAPWTEASFHGVLHRRIWAELDREPQQEREKALRESLSRSHFEMVEAGD